MLLEPHLMEKIKESVLFNGMNEEEITTALEELCAAVKSYKKGERILFAGQTAPFMGFVLSGSVTIENNDIWGNRTILSRADTGQFFAETYALLKNEPLLVDVAANEESRILLLKIDGIQTLKNFNSSWSVKLISNMLLISAHKNLLLSNRSLHTSPKTIRERVMSYLNSLSLKKHSREFDIPFDRQQLADYLNLERSALSKELGKMQRDNLITVKKNHFTVTAEV